MAHETRLALKNQLRVNLLVSFVLSLAEVSLATERYAEVPTADQTARQVIELLKNHQTGSWSKKLTAQILAIFSRNYPGSVRTSWDSGYTLGTSGGSSNYEISLNKISSHSFELVKTEDTISHYSLSYRTIDSTEIFVESDEQEHKRLPVLDPIVEMNFNEKVEKRFRLVIDVNGKVTSSTEQTEYGSKDLVYFTPSDLKRWEDALLASNEAMKLRSMRNWLPMPQKESVGIKFTPNLSEIASARKKWKIKNDKLADLLFLTAVKKCVEPKFAAKIAKVREGAHLPHWFVIFSRTCKIAETLSQFGQQRWSEGTILDYQSAKQLTKDDVSNNLFDGLGALDHEASETALREYSKHFAATLHQAFQNDPGGKKFAALARLIQSAL